MTGQPKWQSAIESVANVLAGFGIALLAQIVVFPMFGIHIAMADNLAIGGIFTGVSIVRSYALRRAFNAWHTYHNRG